MTRLLYMLLVTLLFPAEAQRASLSSGSRLQAGFSEQVFTLTPAAAGMDHEFDVPADLDSLYVGLAFDENVTVLLEDPTGTAATQQAPVSGGVRFVIPMPAAGSWRLSFSHDQTAKHNVSLQIAHNRSPTPRTGTIVDFTNVEGSGVTLSVALFQGTLPVTDAKVSIRIPRGTEPVTVVHAFDNGQIDNADALTGDGLYSAFVTGLKPGFYMASSTATLPDGVTAGSSEFFQVYPVTATLTGHVSDAAVDVDGDLLIDMIELTLGVDVTMPGEYSAEALLRASNGNEAWTKNGYTILGADSSVITTELSARDFKEKLGVDGPFELKDVRLLWTPMNPRTGPNTHIATRFLDHGWTQAHELSKLTRPYLVFTRYLGDAGLDLDGNGLFDVIRVSFEFDSAIVGDHHYSWNAWLKTEERPSDRETDIFAINTGIVSPGLNVFTLDFPVKTFAMNGTDGPYVLSQLSLYPTYGLPGAYGRTTGENRNPEYPRVLGITQAYAASQFEGTLPGTGFMPASLVGSTAFPSENW